MIVWGFPHKTAKLHPRHRVTGRGERSGMGTNAKENVVMAENHEQPQAQEINTPPILYHARIPWIDHDTARQGALLVLAATAGTIDQKGVYIYWRSHEKPAQHAESGVILPFKAKMKHEHTTDGVDIWKTTLICRGGSLSYVLRLEQCDTDGAGRTICWQSSQPPLVTLNADAPPIVREADEFVVKPGAKACTVSVDTKPIENSEPDWLPAWVSKGVTIYQIFPDRFAPREPHEEVPHPPMPWGVWVGNPEKAKYKVGGTLKGILDHVNHLKELGIGAVYLNPVFKANRYHRYDTVDYADVDEELGTNADLIELIHTLHQEGIRVILDGVFNHCSEEHPKYKEACKNGMHAQEWFETNQWSDEPAEWTEHYDEEPPRSEPLMPRFNTRNPQCQKYLASVATKWMNEVKKSAPNDGTSGTIDGWRLDAADKVNPSFWVKFRAEVHKVNKECWLVGEILKDRDAKSFLFPDKSNAKNSDDDSPDKLDSVMSQPWTHNVIRFVRGESAFDKAQAFLDERLNLECEYSGLGPERTPWLVNVLGNHDTTRIRTHLGSARAALATVITFTSPGIPLIYYGDEIGMEGANDPDCRRCMEWNRNRWDKATFELHKRLVQLRRHCFWLSNGGFSVINHNINKHGFVVYRRSSSKTLGQKPPLDVPGQSLWVLVNAIWDQSPEMPKLKFPLYPKAVVSDLIEDPSELVDVLNDGATFTPSRNKEGTLTACVEVPWLSARILMPRGDYEDYVRWRLRAV